MRNLIQFSFVVFLLNYIIIGCSNESNSTSPSETKNYSVNNASIDFGGVDVNKFSTKQIIITNTGTANITINSITCPDGFSVDWLQGTIQPQATQVINVKFSPTIAQTYTNVITLNSDSGNKTIAVSGIGVGVLAFACGIYSTYIVKTDGTLWATGGNQNGELGNGNALNSSVLIKIGTDNDWKTVSSGHNFVIGLKKSGTMWSWGINDQGQLGIGTTVNNNVPVQIGGSSNWIGVSCGFYHTLAKQSDGSLWSWGGNIDGQVGNGTTNNQLTPVQIYGNTNSSWCDYVAKGFSSWANLPDCSTVNAWGYNASGMFGDGTTTNRGFPLTINSYSDVSNIGNSKYYPGVYHVLRIFPDGSLYSIGANNSGQLGISSTFNKNTWTRVGSSYSWSSASGGWDYCMALDNGGNLWSWGANNFGQLGNGTTNNLTSPTIINSGWKSIVAGNFHSLGLKTDGTLWSWGANNVGQLGDGTTVNKNVPIQIF